MSALGHKQTFAVHQPMSALPSKATAKADISCWFSEVVASLGVKDARATGLPF
jgi:hypothetical protein